MLSLRELKLASCQYVSNFYKIELNSYIQILLILTIFLQLFGIDRAQAETTESSVVNNSPPSALHLNFTGHFRASSTIFATYDYVDPENDPEQGTQILWYRSDDVTGTNKQQIAADVTNYGLLEADIGKFISLEVTPSDEFGPGETAVLVHEVAVDGFTPPVASNVSFTGILREGELLSPVYTYFDANGDPEFIASSDSNPDGTLFNWYASDDALGNNKTLVQSSRRTQGLTLQASMVNKYISFEVIVTDQFNYFGGQDYSQGEPVESQIKLQPVSAFPAIYLTEIMYKEHEFMEWFNFGDTPVDISNWQVYREVLVNARRGEWSELLVLTIADGTVIPAGGCLILTSLSASDFNQAWGATPSHCVLYDADAQGRPSGTGEPQLGSGRHNFRLTTSARNTEINYVYLDRFNNDFPTLEGASSLYLNLQMPDIRSGVPQRSIEVNSQQWANTTTERGAGVLSAPGVFASGEQAIASPFRFFYPAEVAVSQNDQPPTASNLTVAETGATPRVLQAAYQYSDTDGEIDSHSTYAWYRATQSDGADRQVLTDENGLTYTVAGEDVGNYIIFEVTPANIAGNGSAVQSAPFLVTEIQNAAPVAQNLAVDGNIRAGFTLNLTYTYSDAEGNPETGSTFRWFRADDATGTNKQPISGATSSQYILQLDDIGKFISAEVTPSDSFGAGVAVETEIATTPVDGFDPPVASNVRFSGEVAVGRTLTGLYDYSDPNSDPELRASRSPGTLPGTLYQWYMSDDASGRNKQLLVSKFSDSDLTVLDFMLGKFLSFEVSPGDQYTYFGETRSSRGEPVESDLSQTIPVAPLSRMIATEINFNSASGNFIEIFNFNEHSVDVSNWRAWRTGSTGHLDFNWSQIISSGTVIPAGGCLILTQMTADAFAAAWGNAPANCVVQGSSNGLIYPASSSRRYLRFDNELGSNIFEIDTSLMTSANGWPEITSDTSIFLNKQISEVRSASNSIVAEGSNWLQSADMTGQGRLSNPGTLSGGQEIGSPYEHFGGDATVTTNDNPPTVSNVTIISATNNQNTLMGSYVYQDAEQDAETLSIYAWYRSDFVDGSARQLISGATGQSYNLVQEDIGKYILFGVTPRNRQAVGSQVLSSPRLAEIQATAPTVSDLNLTGIFRAAQTVFANYTYSDAEGDEDQSTIKWFRSDDASGTNKAEIVSASQFMYQLQLDDIGKFISFEITPTDVLGTAGTPVESGISSEAVQGFTPPVAQNVTYSGSYQVGEILTGSYDYFDAENDPEVLVAPNGNSNTGTTYNWYASDTPQGTRTLLKTSKFDLTLTISTSNVGKYLTFEVIPVDTYNNFGNPAFSTGEPASSPVPVNPVSERKVLTLTEFMYNSLTPYTGRYAQYLEWFNFHDEAIDISGWVFNTRNLGVEYTFPDNTIIPAGGCLVLTNADSPQQNEFTTSWGGVPDNCTLIGPQQTNSNQDYFWNLDHFYLESRSYLPVFRFLRNGVSLSTFSLVLDDSWPENIQGRSIQLSVPVDEVSQMTESALLSGENWRNSENITGIGANSTGQAVIWWNNNEEVGSPFTYLGGTGQSSGKNATPVATNVTITGTMVNRQTITVEYYYVDSAQNPETTTLVRLYGYDSAEGGNKTLITTLSHIASGNTASYTLRESDIGKYISAEVIPGSRNTRGQLVASSITPIAVRSLDGGLNNAPVIDGSPATSVMAGEDYEFTPQASDTDSLSLTFTIANQPSWSSFNNQTGQLSGTPTTSDRGNYLNIVISVSDGLDTTSLPAFNIEVIAPNTSPVANAGDDQSVNEGATVSLSGASSSDSDGAISSYSWQQTGGVPTVTLSGASLSSASFVAPSVTQDTVLTFTLTVTDNEGATDTDTVSVNILHSNQAPIANAGQDQTVNEASTVSLSGTTSSDPDGSISSYSWQQTAGQPAVTLSNASSVTASFTAPVLTQSTTLTFTLTIIDNEGASNSDSVNVTINPVNTSPQANAGQDITVNEGSTVNLSGTGSLDPDGSISGYLWQQSAGIPSVSIDNATSATASFSAPAVTEDTTLVITLTVTDNEGATDTDTVSVTINALNVAPQADAGRNASFEEGSTVNLSGDASLDSDGSIESYSWQQTSGPTVALNDANASNASFTAPSVTEDTVLSFSLTVTDNEGAEDTDSVDIIITDTSTDFDGDGLTDVQEAELGTDPTNPDSDGDGLSDGDEVNVYETDPLNSDSDNDGFSDSEEIAQGTSPNDSSSTPDTDRVKWSHDTGGVIFSSPAIASDGTIYIGTRDNSLDALNADGSVKWRFATGARVFSAPLVADDGTVYVGSDDNFVYAINADGSLKWSYETGGSVSSSPAIASDGTVYVGSDDNSLYALNADGTLKWSYTTGFLVSSSPAIASDGTVYVGSYDNALYALNPDGSLKWSYQTGDWVFASPAIGPDGTVYIGSVDHSLYAINADGSLKWSYPTGDRIFSSPAVAEDGTVYVGSLDDHMYAINADGSLKWMYNTGWIERSSPAIAADGTVYVGSYDGPLFALNSDGSLKWRFTTGGPVTPSPAIAADGTVYIGSHDGKLYALNEDNGGLARAGWPKFGGNNQNTANVDDGQGSKATAFDFDGDGKADVGLRRPETSFWYVNNSSGSNRNSDRQDGIQRVRFGLQENYIPVAADYDGDGITDYAVRSPSDANWYIINSSGSNLNSEREDGIQRIRFGLRADDIPVPADYDGDGKTDIAVRRSSTHYWYILNSSGVDPLTGNEDGISRVQFGRNSADIPVPADYDGDGKADLAVRRPGSSIWYILNSSGTDPLTGNSDGITRQVFGTEVDDIPVPADFDGDNRADLAFRRPGNQTWYVLNSSGSNYNSDRQDGIQRVEFGRNSTDIPIVADYDGDGIADFAVRRPATSFQYILNSSGQDGLTEQSDGISRLWFGSMTTDIPVAAPISIRMEMLNTAQQESGFAPELTEFLPQDAGKDEFGLALEKVKTAEFD